MVAAAGIARADQYSATTASRLPCSPVPVLRGTPLPPVCLSRGEFARGATRDQWCRSRGANLSLHSYRDMPYMEVTRLALLPFMAGLFLETQCFWKYRGGRRPPRVRKLPAAAALRRLRHPGRGGAFFAKSQRSQLKSQHFKPAGTSSDVRPIGSTGDLRRRDWRPQGARPFASTGTRESSRASSPRRRAAPSQARSVATRKYARGAQARPSGPLALCARRTMRGRR